MQWEVFFGPDNDEALRWTTISRPGNRAASELKPFLDLVERRAPVAALPRIRAGSTTLYWYVGWRNQSDARFAQDLLRSFLGRTYADLRAPLRMLEAADAAEQAFADEFDGRAVRIEVSWELRTEARAQLLRMAHRLLERPVRSAARVRPVGRILRDFELDLQTGDDAGARAEIETLRSGGHLDETNLAFLELRRLGALRAWSAIVSHESLQSLLGFTSLPWQVRSVILQALFHEYLEAPAEQADLDEALRRLRTLHARYKVVFASRRYVVGPEAAACFLLADALRVDYGFEDADELRLSELEAAGLTAFTRSFRARFAKKVAPRPAATVEAARIALAESELDRAFDIAAASAPSVARARLLLQCARLLDADEAAVTAIAACDDLTESERAEVFSFAWCRSAYDYLNRDLGSPAGSASAPPAVVPSTIDSWRAWFARLNQVTTWPGAVARASMGTTEWDVEVIAGDPDALAEIVSTLGGNLPSWASDALRQSIPYVIDAFLCEPPDPRSASIAEALFELLATDDAISPASASALVRLAQPYLAAKPGAYSMVVDTVASTIDRVVSPRAAGVLEEALEMLATNPVGSRSALENAAVRICSAAGRYWMRLDAVDRALIRNFVLELSVPDVLPPDPAAEEAGDATFWGATLAGQTIALYSLTESALNRAVAALRAACPGAEFKAFCEDVGTAPMREAARTTDLFVIATRSAKHAATGFIMQHRKGPVAYAGGKGSASLVEAVRRWAEDVGPASPP